MKHFLYIVILLSVLSSCSEYQKALKAEDIATKFKLGDSLYSQGKYEKANKLFAQIVPSYKGKPQAERLMFLYSNTFYEMKDYFIAGYQFERFVSSYPRSEKAEEAAFLSAKSYYTQSPIYSKDQKATIEAIEKLQNFLNNYPESEYAPEANALFKELDFKLEKKAFEIAKQYALIAPGYTKDFNSAIKSFDNFIFEFPGSVLREDALFYKLDAAYQQAMNSVENKKESRLKQAKEYYTSFKKNYSDSKHVQDADNMAISLDEELKNYSNKS